MLHSHRVFRYYFLLYPLLFGYHLLVQQFIPKLQTMIVYFVVSLPFVNCGTKIDTEILPKHCEWYVVYYVI